MNYEWVVLAYTLFTLAFILFAYTNLPNARAMIVGRLHIVAIMLALWVAYRLMPCRLTRLARVAAQMALLAWWYPDTYELNRILPNQDHLFATWEQQLFGCQPALLFSQLMPQAWFSELMALGYASYYPLIAVCLLWYFFFRNKEFEHASFVLLASFFAYYVIFDLVPVAGPQFYYAAIGLDQAIGGIFPSVGDYFNQQISVLEVPGWKDGLFYQLVACAHDAGERPTAAFPSSQVGITVVLLLLAWRGHSRRQWLFWLFLLRLRRRKSCGTMWRTSLIRSMIH